MRARAVGKIFQSMLTDVSFALQETVNKYKLKINDGNKDVEENLEIDTEKQTEIYRIPKTDSRNGGEVDIVYDFKKVNSFSWWSASKVKSIQFVFYSPRILIP